MNDPLIDVETNIRGTIVLLEECVRAKIKKFIFPSSGGAIYGNQNKEFLTEDDLQSPISPYAISKLAIEKYLEYYRLNHNLEYLILRYSNPYGPGQDFFGRQGIIPIFLNLTKQKKPVTIFGDGNNVRDYIYIDDAIDLTQKLAFCERTKHRLYNLGRGKGVTINEVVEIIQKVVGVKMKINRLPSRSVDVRRVVLDTAKIKKEIDHYFSVSLEEGIIRTWQWVKDL